MTRFAQIVWFALLMLSVATGAQASDMLTSKQHAQYETLIQNLRCLVCQNQAVAESDSDFAKNIKRIVKQRLQQGETPKQIEAYLVARFSDFISYTPPKHWRTAGLWLAPIGFIWLSAFLGWLLLRKSRAQPNHS